MSGPLKFSRINLKNYPFSVICLIQARDVIAVHKITGVVLYLNRKKFNPPYDQLFVNIFGVCKKTRVFWSKNTVLSSFSGSPPKQKPFLKYESMQLCDKGLWNIRRFEFKI